MATADDPLLAPLKEEAVRLLADARRLVEVRWRLLQLEFRGALSTLRRLVVSLLIAAVLSLAGLPLLLSALAEGFTVWWGWPRWLGLIVLGGGCLLAALTLGWTQWMGFRRRFSGVEQSLEELREDANWLREHLARRR